MDLPSRLDLLSIGRDFLVQRAKKIDPLQADILGSDANIALGVGSVMGYAVVIHLAFAVSRLLLSSAEDEDLDRLILDRYNLPRKGAAPAVGMARIYRDATGASGSVDVGTKLLSVTGIEYITTQVANFGASTLTTTARVRAAQAGKLQQVGANSVRRFANVSSLFDSKLKVNNDERMAGGEDRESNEDYRERSRKFWAAQRRGVLGAIEFGALSVPGVASARAIEALNTDGRPARVVNLYIADSSGVANAALGAVVDEALIEWRAGGIAVLVFPSLPQIISIALKLVFEAGVSDTVTLADRVRAAVVEYVNSLPVNGTLYRGELMAVLTRYKIDGLIVSNDSIVDPVGDLVPAIGSTLRTTTSNVTLAA